MVGDQSIVFCRWGPYKTSANMMTRYSDEQKKHHRRAVLGDKGKERMYFYPPDDEDPSPMYEGLRTNLPNVSTYRHLTDEHKVF